MKDRSTHRSPCRPSERARVPTRASIVAALFLAACGGDGDGDSPADDAGAVSQRLVGVERTGLDGETDVIAYAWDDGGTLLAQTTTFADGGVRRLDFVHEDGRPVAADEDADGDGVVDARRRYGYDANGRQVSREIDGDLDGEYESSTGWSIDESGLASARFAPAGCEPSACASESELYIRLPPRGRAARRAETDTEPDPLDGVAERVMVLSYAGDGRLLSETTTEVANGATATTTFAYEAGPCVADFLNSESAYFCVKAPERATAGAGDVR